MAKRGKNKEYPVPDFSNVSEGEIWRGRNYRADFIKAIGMKPEPAGTHSRDSQEKWIQLFCRVVDDPVTKELCLAEIYSKRLPKPPQTRKKKYESYFAELLLEAISQSKNGRLFTTRKKLLKDIGAISIYYDKIPAEYYVECFTSWLPTLDESDGKINIIDIEIFKPDQDEIERQVKQFRSIAYKRFYSIINSVITQLAKERVITYRKYKMIVDENGQSIPVASDRLAANPVFAHLSCAELVEKLEKAEKWAAQQIEITYTDEKTGEEQHIQLQNFSDVMKLNRFDEYIQHFNKYIKKEYSWKYIYTAYEIAEGSKAGKYSESLTGNRNACEELNELLCEAIKKNIETKNKNMKQNYERKRQELAFYRLENQACEDIREDYRLGIITDEGVIKDLTSYRDRISYRYSSSFLSRVDKYILHEIKCDKKKDNDIFEWLKEHEEDKNEDTEGQDETDDIDASE